MKPREQYKTLMWVVGITLIVVIVSMIIVYKQALRAKKGKAEIVEVTFRLNWIPDPTFTGAYIAKKRGFWESDLNVTIKSGGMNIDPIRLVSEGTDTFGVVGANRLLQARAEGYPIVAICAEMQTHPVGWIVRSDSSIKNFRDFEGHRIGLKVGDESETIMKAVLGRIQLSQDQIKLVPVGFSPDPFITGMVDALPVYINEEPHTVESKGVKVRVLHPSQLEISLYGNVIITHKDNVLKKRSVVQAFVSGLLDGWNAARIGTPRAIAKELIEIEPDMGRVPTEKVMISTLELVFGRLEIEKKKLGWMDLEGWQRSKNVLDRYSGLKLNDDLTKIFTNSFVERYYNEK